MVRPESLQPALRDVLPQLQMIADGRIPAVLVPQFVHTVAMRLLRCVYGSDLATATGVRNYVLQNEQMRNEIERKIGGGE